MSRNEQELKGVTLLGNQNTQYSYDYTPEVLETFENKHPENEYLVTLDCPEFTSHRYLGQYPVRQERTLQKRTHLERQKVRHLAVY